MGVLSALEIRKRLSSEDPSDLLFVAPLLEREEQLREDQAGIDIRLGTEFSIAVPALGDAIDTLESSNRRVGGDYQRLYVRLGECIVAHPHQFILGQSLEYLRFPANLGGYVVGRSSWGRRGLVVATAVGIHPNFSGTLTLELRNLGEIPLKLYPGDTIAQLFIHDLTGEPSSSKSLSQFARATSPTLGRLRYSGTERKLRALKERRDRAGD